MKPIDDTGITGQSSGRGTCMCEKTYQRTTSSFATLRFDAVQRSGTLDRYDRQTQQAVDLLASTRARSAFDLAKEPDVVRERYGRTHFGQSVLLARRLVEAGVSLVHVNWFRGPDEPSDAPCWDSHVREALRLKTVLAPPTDQAFSALLEDLAQRGLLDETLVVVASEFGRTPLGEYKKDQTISTGRDPFCSV